MNPLTPITHIMSMCGRPLFMVMHVIQGADVRMALGVRHPRRTQEQELINRKGWGLLVGHQRGLLLGH